MDFETSPDRYRHLKLQVEGAIARVFLAVDPDRPFREGYRLKLNSYDLGVDIELHDAVQRLRFEHPEVKVVIIGSTRPRVFSAGANIMMLASSSHPFKVNFCKFTNDTRCAIEDASSHSGQRYIAALGGTASGGGYELAMACDEIYLADDGSSAVSLPEVPLLGVLPGTGGLTRLVDKRRVRRDLADVFATLAEGCKARKALEWGLIDGAFPPSRFEQAVTERAHALAAELPDKHPASGIRLSPLEPEVRPSGVHYRFVDLEIGDGGRVAVLTVRSTAEKAPSGPQAVHEIGADFWVLRTFREIDDALCRLRFDYESVGLVLIKALGDLDSVLSYGQLMAAHRDDWLVAEVSLLVARTLRRLDGMGKSLFAVVEPGSCFGSELLELALACDRIYMLADDEHDNAIAFGPCHGGELPMGSGLSRLQSRLLADVERAAVLASAQPKLDARKALAQGLVTAAPDAIDWDDELRVAIEERLSLSPDALTGMEAQLRLAGPETVHTKIYGRLSAWQNWIFTRPNATGERGALTLYGRPDRPKFDWRRT